MGVLPYSYTELILERKRAKDHTLESFLDIFNHRAISLFYRGWEKYRFPVAYGVEPRRIQPAPARSYRSWNYEGLQDRQPLPDEALLHYAGLLGLQSRSAAGLQRD